jgi:hypothetical protein
MRIKVGAGISFDEAQTAAPLLITNNHKDPREANV